MSDKPDKHADPKKKGKAKGKMMMMILGGVGLLGIGGGAAYGMIATGIIGGGHHEKEDNQPKLIRKGEEDPYAPQGKEGEEEGAAEVHGEGGSEYRTAYYVFQDEFTSNLKESGALVQISLAASTRRDGRVLMWMKTHELAIRSALLQVLADTPENDISTIEGKEHLQARLTSAINKVLMEKEGFGGVDAVYFKSFIVQ